MHWAQVYRLPAVSVRFFQRLWAACAHQRHLWRGVRRFPRTAPGRQPLTIVGDGEQTRDFTFVSDVVDALIAVAESDKNGEIYNVGSGHPVSVNELVRLLGSPPSGAYPEAPGRTGLHLGRYFQNSPRSRMAAESQLRRRRRASCWTISTTGAMRRYGPRRASPKRRAIGFAFLTLTGRSWGTRDGLKRRKADPAAASRPSGQSARKGQNDRPKSRRSASSRGAPGQSVVQAHGTFDLLHLGHVRHLEAARKLGDMLIVTVTADRFVNKGPGRPVFNAELRAEMLATLEYVDWVAVNDAADAVSAIERIRPSIYIKGQDYQNPDGDITGKIALERQAVEAHRRPDSFHRRSNVQLDRADQPPPQHLRTAHSRASRNAARKMAGSTSFAI